jgi:two-component system phosphate regulon response regulator PhoB
MRTKKCVLVIEDDTENQLLYNDILHEQFDVVIANGGEQGYRMARERHPGVILLDLLMPGMDGLETCNLLRKTATTRQIPIIVVTGSSDYELQLEAFKLGADDLIRKPVRPRELVARIESKISRMQEVETAATATASLECLDLRLEPDRYECYIGPRLVPLSVLQFKILQYFVENFGRVISREKLLKAIWREVAVNNRTVDTHINYLRAKIKGSRLTFVTLYGAGYTLKERLKSEVKE